MSSRDALAVAQAAVSLTRSHPNAPALDVLDMVLRGRADQVLDFDDPASPNGSLAVTSAAFGQLLAAAFDEAMTASSLCAAALTVGFRLGPVTRRFDLPAPEQSLKVQIGGQQCGNEIDGRGTRPRPLPVVQAARKSLRQ